MKILLRISVFLILFASAGCIGLGYAQVPGKEVEVGIVEHLDTIIPLDLTFMSDQNQPVILRDVINKPTLFVLVYFDCPGICPAILSGVSDVIEKTGMELGKDFQVVTVSFNPDDTPEKAAKMKMNYLGDLGKKHPDAWMYFTGDSASINRLTGAAGYRYKRTGMDFMHPSVIMVLSPAGKITRYLYGTSFLPFDVKMALIEAQKGQSRPTINRVLEYCFSYDPEGRKYTLQVTKITATIIIFFAILLFIILIVRSSRKKQKSQKT